MLLNRRGTKGFTIIEVLTVLAILAILIGLLVPVVLKNVEAARTEGTEAGAKRIFEAIFGDPSKGNYGYLGDMGRLPTTLTELLVRGTQTAFHTADGSVDHVGRVGAGWRGPYLTGLSQESILKDAWGVDYSYTNTGSNAGQIISGGPDRNLSTTSDNITFPAHLPVAATGTLVVTVIVNDIPQPTGLTVEVFSTGNGEQGAAVTQTTSPTNTAPFKFTIPHGISVARATHTASGITVTRTVNVPVAANTQVETKIIMKTSASVSM